MNILTSEKMSWNDLLVQNFIFLKFFFEKRNEKTQMHSVAVYQRVLHSWQRRGWQRKCSCISQHWPNAERPICCRGRCVGTGEIETTPAGSPQSDEECCGLMRNIQVDLSSDEDVKVFLKNDRISIAAITFRFQKFCDMSQHWVKGTSWCINV